MLYSDDTRKKWKNNKKLRYFLSAPCKKKTSHDYVFIKWAHTALEGSPTGSEEEQRSHGIQKPKNCMIFSNTFQLVKWGIMYPLGALSLYKNGGINPNCLILFLNKK